MQFLNADLFLGQKYPLVLCKGHISSQSTTTSQHHESKQLTPYSPAFLPKEVSPQGSLLLLYANSPTAQTVKKTSTNRMSQSPPKTGRKARDHSGRACLITGLSLAHPFCKQTALLSDSHFDYIFLYITPKIHIPNNPLLQYRCQLVQMC